MFMNRRPLGWKWSRRVAACGLGLALAWNAACAHAQQGDHPGESQTLLVPKDQIPPSPVLSPTEALKSFRLKPGFRIELVASEPLVHDPVAMTWDPDGRLYVLEMRGFMPNADGVGEREPVGSVAVLDDTDGDGVMDKRTEFVRGLVLPRALALVRDGLLVAEPPMLWFFRDTNGDGVADEKTEVANDYATQADPKLADKANPEHASNSLMSAMDNWIYSANHTVRFRLVLGKWERDTTTFRGQWGMSQDDQGRLVYNSNSDQLRMDLFPATYLLRNPRLTSPAGLNVDPVGNQKTWPIRVTPGINRGYQPAMLRDGRLAQFTAACGPVIYRGDQFPAEFRGNAFVCEPSGNLVKRNLLEEQEGIVRGRHAYEDSEFLASTDERFRPVNAFNGPDGSLYLVDMYRGILQHRIYLTSYLRQQIQDRELAAPTGLGRIYRVYHESRKPARRPAMTKAPAVELVRHLSHPNGWWRDTAQRLLVERADSTAVAAVRRLAGTEGQPVAQMHALWMLDGARLLDRSTHAAALSSTNAKVRATAIRLSEPFLSGPPAGEVLSQLLNLVKNKDLETRIYLAFIFGQMRHARAEGGLLQIARDGIPNDYLRDALVSSLGGRELEFLTHLAEGSPSADPVPGVTRLYESLARCVFAERKPERVQKVLELAASARATPARTRAIVDGILANRPAPAKGRPPAPFDPLVLPAEPAALAALGRAADTNDVQRVSRLVEMFDWPGKQRPANAAPEAKPLTEEQQKRFELGKELYVISCGACHQPHGNGQEGLAPPLAGSEWVVGSEERIIRIVLQGVRGPITVLGKTYQLEMPAFGVFDDDQLASILTYVRREWNHQASAIEPATVARIRKATESRLDAWTETELLQIP